MSSTAAADIRALFVSVYSVDPKPRMAGTPIETVRSAFVMSIHSQILRPSTRCWGSLSRMRFSQRCSIHHMRQYATHPEGVNLNNPTSHLSQSLDTKHQRSSVRPDTVGPFQLGISQQALRSGEKVKKWSELSTGGKGTSPLTPWLLTGLM